VCIFFDGYIYALPDYEKCKHSQVSVIACSPYIYKHSESSYDYLNIYNTMHTYIPVVSKYSMVSSLKSILNTLSCTG